MLRTQVPQAQTVRPFFRDQPLQLPVHPKRCQRPPFRPSQLQTMHLGHLNGLRAVERRSKSARGCTELPQMLALPLAVSAAPICCLGTAPSYDCGRARGLMSTLSSSCWCDSSAGRRWRSYRSRLAAPERSQSGGARLTDSVTLKPAPASF